MMYICLKILNMKKWLLIFVLIFALVSCKKTQTRNSSVGVDTPQVEKYYENIDSGAIVISNPIMYDVIVRNPDPNDDWTDYCLANTNIKPLMNVIFKAIYTGRLTPYYYRSDDSIIPIDSVKELESLITKNPIGKLQFQEKWYIDEDSLKFYKKVESIVFGYERKTVNGEVYGYKALFRVYLDGTHNNVAK